MAESTSPEIDEPKLPPRDTADGAAPGDAAQLWMFRALLLFFVCYYIRPHEWNAAIAKLELISRSMAFALAALVCARWQQSRLRPGEFLKTPLDWIMLMFLLYILFVSADAGDTWSRIYNLFAFYLVTTHALNSLERILAFLRWWLALLMIIVGIGLASHFGFDPLNCAGVTARFQGRLALNLSLFHNPNSYGHSIIPSLPLIYYLLIWRHWVFGHWLYPVYLFPLYCLYLTKSKGSFISGAGGLFSIITFGRPLVFQAVCYLAVYSFGTSVLLYLPRMGTMSNVKGDKGVQGRMFAWNFGWESMQALPNGLGYGRFRSSARTVGFQKVREQAAAEAKFITERWMRRKREDILGFRDRVEAFFIETEDTLKARQALEADADKFVDRVLPVPPELREAIEDGKKAEKRLAQQRSSLQFEFYRFKEEFGSERFKDWTLIDLRQSKTIREKELAFAEILDDREKEVAQGAYDHLFAAASERITHAPHCSIVEVGGELGKRGLYLWLGIIYYCFKILVFSRRLDLEEERVRRIMFGVMLCTAISAWMTNICFRGSFYVQAGIISAFARYLGRKREESLASDDSAEETEDHAGEEAQDPARDSEASRTTERTQELKGARAALRILRTIVIDGLMIFLCYLAAIRTWLYIMNEWQGF